MDYVRLLVRKGFVDAAAVDLVQKERDAPGFGNELRVVGGEKLW